MQVTDVLVGTWKRVGMAGDRHFEGGLFSDVGDLLFGAEHFLLVRRLHLARHIERGGGLSFLAMCTHRGRADAGQVGAERRGRCEQAVARDALTSGAGGGAHQWGIPKETAGAGYYVSW